MTPDATRPRQFAFGPFRLLPAQQLLLEGESPVRLGGRARDLLIALLEQAGQVITKEALNARLWPNIAVEEGTLRVHVAALRKALRDGQEGQRYITNIAGRGYAFVGEVVATDGPDRAADAPPEPIPPLSMMRLFGRAEVVETLSTRLAQQRLITITGPGGIGKTSVALAVADRMRPGLPDGVCVVDFAPLADSKLVPTALASALAVQLFVERAAMCLGEFSLTDAHAPAVANICRRLDGIPLAIEMAAGRVDAFGIAGLAGVLDDRFRLAMRGRRTALPRHQTLSTAGSASCLKTRSRASWGSCAAATC
jgi:DNA-binding winged helix-turn-helix (wHTH) protein